ncbi:MAG: spermidine synthase, partial [Myxococcaceae bacterium]|nr:spermidine synthase [Myxococcaceae bacterium]
MLTTEPPPLLPPPRSVTGLAGFFGVVTLPPPFLPPPVRTAGLVGFFGVAMLPPPFLPPPPRSVTGLVGFFGVVVMLPPPFLPPPVRTAGLAGFHPPLAGLVLGLGAGLPVAAPPFEPPLRRGEAGLRAVATLVMGVPGVESPANLAGFCGLFARLISRPLLHILFFLSGGAALLYQVIWVRQFGNLFGNGVWSAALVTAIFMAGLGVGGHAAGRIADRRPTDGLRIYGFVEVSIGCWGFLVATALPMVGSLSPSFSAYASGPQFFSLTVGSWFGRVAIVTLLLLPSTLLMGATLTLLIRHVLLAKEGAVEGWRTGALYGANTGGAALGAVLADFVLVPQLGAHAAQLVAVGINVAVGAIVLSRFG